MQTLLIIFHYRNSQRIVHIPFFAPTTSTSPSNLRRCEMQLKQARKDASASFGTLIALGESIMAEENQKYLDDTALPLVAASLPGLHFRVQKCYALLLIATKTVSANLCVMFKFC